MFISNLKKTFESKKIINIFWIIYESEIKVLSNWGNYLCPKRLLVLVFVIFVEVQMGMFGFPSTTPCMFSGIPAMPSHIFPSKRKKENGIV